LNLTAENETLKSLERYQALTGWNQYLLAFCGKRDIAIFGKVSGFDWLDPISAGCLCVFSVDGAYLLLAGVTECSRLVAFVKRVKSAVRSWYMTYSYRYPHLQRQAEV
jgi:hypothetical protein